MTQIDKNENPTDRKIFFSVIVPIYNIKDFLPRAVDSLLGQTFKGGVEILLVDDGSTDGSHEICDDYARRFPDRVRVIHKVNAGCPAARNTGLDAAQGDYIAFLDGDDWFEPEAFQNFYDCLLVNKVDVLLFSAWTVLQDGSRFINKETKKKSPKGKVLSQEEFLEQDFFGSLVWNTIYPSDFIRIHKLRFNETLWGPDDTDFAVRAGAYAETVFLLDYPAYNFFLRRGSITHDKAIKNVLKKIGSYCEMLEILCKFPIPKSSIFEKKLVGFIQEVNFNNFRSVAELPVVFKTDSILARFRKHGFYPLPKWSSHPQYRLFRFLTVFRVPFILIQIIYRLLPPNSLVWKIIAALRSLVR